MALAPTRVASSDKTEGIGDDVGELKWSVHLRKARPGAARRIMACAGFVAVAGAVWFHNPLLGLIPAAVIVLSLSEFLLPIHYTFSNKGVTLKNGLTWLEMPWTDVRHAYLTEDGVKLSPLRAKNARNEWMRGIYVRFDADNRESVLDWIRARKPEQPTP